MSTLLTNCLLHGTITNILVDGERIAKIGNEVYEHTREIDVGKKIVIPGMIDLHTHIRDMKQSYKEDWITAGRAALQGGVTTVFDMPNTNPPTTDANNYQTKKGYAKKSSVNFGLYAGATPDNYSEMKMFLDEEANVAGVKIFLAGSSSNEVVTDDALLTRFFILAKQYNKPVLVHCESQEDINNALSTYQGNEYNSVQYHNKIRSTQAAAKAVRQVLSIAAKVKNKLIILHVSSAAEIEIIKEFKRNCDFPLYCEVTPHHLLLNEQDLPFCGNYGKVNPPIRTKTDNDALWQALGDGFVDTIGSDHAPHSLEEKNNLYFAAPSGFPGLETTLPLLLNESITSGRIRLDKIVELTSLNPSKIMNIYKRGKIEPGYFADLTVIDPNHSWEVDPSAFETKAKYSPYEGRTLKGKIAFTMVNGKTENQQGKEIEYE